MWAPMLLLLSPVPDDTPGFLKRLERLFPGTRLAKTAKEPSNHAVLLWRKERNRLLLQVIVSARLPEASTLEDQAIVAPNRRCSDWPERAEPLEACCFDRALAPPSPDFGARTRSRSSPDRDNP